MRRVGSVLLLLAAFTAGCDRSSSGKGDWAVTVEGPGAPFGAAVVSVSGDGVLDVTARGGIEIWTHEVEEGEFRAVIIQPSPSGDMTFRVRVREVRDPPPSVAILELADVEDQAVTVTGEHVLRMRR
jgi:hypothetical protein